MSLLAIPLPSATAVPTTGSDTPNTGTDAVDPAFWLKLAKDQELAGNWESAFDYYSHALSINRDLEQAKRGCRFCLRHIHRRYRHGDSAFRQQLLDPDFGFTDSLTFYKHLLRKIKELYIEADKIQLNHLVRDGREELCLALEDPLFRKWYLPDNTSMTEVDKFCGMLRTEGVGSIKSMTQAAEHVRSLAKSASRKLGLNFRVAVVEMGCGACNCLDQHSFYLPQFAISGFDSQPSITARMVETGIGYIRLSCFYDESTVQELDAALNQLENNGMKALILDLRNNPGGSFDAAVAVAERFLPAPLSIASTTGKLNKTYQSFSMNALDIPVYVLIDDQTASSAELLAGALKVHERAELIGETTFGKRKIQKMIPLGHTPFGALRITWAQFYLPKGQGIKDSGPITPTIPQPLHDSPGQESDRQFDVALAHARLVVMQ